MKEFDTTVKDLLSRTGPKNKKNVEDEEVIESILPLGEDVRVISEAIVITHWKFIEHGITCGDFDASNVGCIFKKHESTSALRAYVCVSCF